MTHSAKIIDCQSFSKLNATIIDSCQQLAGKNEINGVFIYEYIQTQTELHRYVYAVYLAKQRSK